MSQEELLETIQSLASNKKRERMVSIEKLEFLLEKDDVQNYLFSNTGSGSITWDILFIRVHNAVLGDLAEASSKNKKVIEKHIQMMQNTILIISQKSVHDGVPLLGCDTLVSSILSVFESNYRMNYLGSIYTDLLAKYVLTHRKFWGEIKLEQWIELKNICQRCFIQPPPKVQSVVYLEALSEIIRLGCKNVIISQELLNVFSFVTNTVSSHKSLCITYAISLLRLINILCLQLAVEFRFVVCSFVEEVFDFVINLFERRKSSKNPLIFHFLIIYLNVHNPNGVSERDESFYAFDENKWRQQIMTIFSIAQETAKGLSKSSDLNDVEVGFLDLFLDINYLAHVCEFNGFFTFNWDTESESYSDIRTPSNKRKRLSDSLHATLISNKLSGGPSKLLKRDDNFCSVIKDLESSDALFWLTFLEMLLQKYPHILMTQFRHFVEVLGKLLHNCRDTLKARSVCRCLCIILSKKKDFETSHMEDEDQLNDIWCKIGLELIRLFEMEEAAEYHRLIKLLIVNSRFRNPVPLLNLYSRGIMTRNNDSLSTLLTVCQSCLLPESITEFELESDRGRCKFRLFLLKWLFQERIRYPAKELSKILITLMRTRSEEEIEVYVPKNSEIVVTSRNINDFCKFITSIYDMVSMKGLNFVDRVKLKEPSITPKIDDRMQSELFCCLESRRNELHNELLDEDDLLSNGRVNTIRDVLHYCELLSSLYTYMKTLNLETENWVEPLGKMKSLLFLATSKSYDLMKNRFYCFAPFVSLYSSDYHDDICKLIREKESTYVLFLQHLFKVFQERGNVFSDSFKQKKEESKSENNSDLNLNSGFSSMINNQRSILHLKSLSEEERRIVETVEVLCHFIISPGSSGQNRFQKVLEGKLIDDLINDDSLNFHSNCHLQIVFRVMYNFSQFEGIDSDTLNKNLSLLNLVYKSKNSDSEISVVILQIMKEFINLIGRISDELCEKNFLSLITGFRTSIKNKKRHGMPVVLKYIELLIEILNIEWRENSIFSVEGSEVAEFCQEIILFLKHPCYEVRLFAARHIGKLFAFPKKNTQNVIDSQQMLLNLLRNTLLDGNDVAEENGTTMLVSPYCKIMGISVSLIAWTSITCFSSYWRRLALFNLIQFSCNEHYNKGKVSRALNVICNELGITNCEKFILYHLPYLFQKWVEAGYEAEEFPFYVLGYRSEQEFLENHSNLLLTMYSWCGRFHAVSAIAEKQGKTVKDILKNCFPEFMAVVLSHLGKNVRGEKVRNANIMKLFIEKELGSISSELLIKDLSKIIFRMFYFMEDVNYLNDLTRSPGISFEECCLIRLTMAQIEEGLENITGKKCLSFLGALAIQQPYVIQKVLILLSGDVELAPTLDDKVWSLHKYIAFVEMLSKSTRTSPFRNIVTFIVRDVIHTLMSFIRSCNHKRITKMGLKCLDKLLRNYIQEFSSVLGDFLSVLAVLCKPLVQDGNEEALEILKFLICENSSRLSSAIAKLDSFPNEKVFDEINRMLDGNKSQWVNVKDALTHFLDVSGEKKCAVEGLKHLRIVLTNRKEELRLMCEDLKKLRGFSEDCSKSLIHQTICSLIELTTASNRAVRVEAAKCLGELGPLDLATLVLKPENHCAEEKHYKSSLFRMLKLCIKYLSDLIIHENFEIKSAASELLHIIVGSHHGNEILKELNPKMRCYLLPYSPAGERVLSVKESRLEYKNKLDESSLWIPGEIHENWIQNLVTELLRSFTDNCGLLGGMTKMVEINGNFAERMFPVVLDLILSFGDGEAIEIIKKNIGLAFAECFNRSQASGLSLNLRSLHCMVNVVDYIRIQRNFEGVHDELNLKLNYLHVAEAARCCSAFFTSTLYVELWFNERKKFNRNLSFDNICELYPDEGFIVTKILRDCYSKIGIFDGIHGCGYTHLLDFATESQHYEYMNKWNISMLYHDVELSQGSQNSERLLLNSLHRFGMIHCVSNLIRQSGRKEELMDIQYKCAAVLSDWNLFDNVSDSVRSIDSYEKSHYFALKAFHDNNHSAFHNELQKARKCTINKLSSCSLESVENLYCLLSELRCLKELEDFESVARISSLENFKSLNERWNKQDRIECSDFGLIENILSQRVIAVREESSRSVDPEVKSFLHMMLCETHYKLLKSARKEKRYETAIRNLSYLSRMENLPDSVLGNMKIEKSLLEWEIGDKNVGKFLLRHYLQQGEIKGQLRAKALRIYGDWLASTNSENSRNIIEQYYRKSIEISKGGRGRVNSYASFARFADSNYEQLRDYLTSPLYEMKKNLINRQQDLASELRQEISWNQDRDKKIACRLAERQSVIDQKEIRNSESEMDLFLSLAVRYYLLSLNEGDKYDFLVFRLISLWFSNPDRETVLNQLKEHLDGVPSHKFLCLLPQILPRMDEIGLISNLIERILKDHPYHTLPVLFAVANSFEDAKYGEGRSVSQSQRSLIARAMLEKFRKDRRLGNMILQMDQFCDAAIELANTSTAEQKTAKSGIFVDIPPNLKISKLKNLEFVAVPSVTIPPRKNCNYDNVTGIKGFETRYQLVGGINLPKKINCVGLDGVGRALLIKGRDDLRQDAVMQQVFTVINSLLHRNPETNKRKLVIRTYRVVPLSHRSGIIEWCENTQPLSLYLIGPDGASGAHKKFNPRDITAVECRSRMRQAFGVMDGTNNLKLQVFLDICERIQPVFRNFFFEKFSEPGVWFERRLAYTHSVATSSMIGYVLGIGDRHVHNILIDNATAEVIHIDLGIAFEQGKTLPTPETVPFRLTRDIVDGMGMSGVEGVFRLSCIKTMEVLRENHHTILTLLEVLLYDPLYAWTITAEKALSVQGHTGTDSSSEKNSSQVEINKMAERALIRLKQKLQGMETGGVVTTAEGQVNYLIQQARDPNNLCRLFHGWQPYL